MQLVNEQLDRHCGACHMQGEWFPNLCQLPNADSAVFVPQHSQCGSDLLAIRTHHPSTVNMTGSDTTWYMVLYGMLDKQFADSTDTHAAQIFCKTKTLLGFHDERAAKTGDAESASCDVVAAAAWQGVTPLPAAESRWPCFRQLLEHGQVQLLEIMLMPAVIAM
jgi:hypothetical protein